MKPPAPLCLVFQPCNRVVDHGNRGVSIEHVVRLLTAPRYPLLQNLGFYACCASSHGVYQFEIQLQLPTGEVVWRDGPPFTCPMHDPLVEYDFNFNLQVTFPMPGIYEFVLVANRDEIARRKFTANLSPQLAERS